jgi:hypothetical protein
VALVGVDVFVVGVFAVNMDNAFAVAAGEEDVSDVSFGE